MAPTENQLRNAVDDLKKSTAPADTVDVEWRDAAPADRPEGIAWAPDPGQLTYDLWSGQRRTLDALRSGDPDLVPFSPATGPGSRCSALGGYSPKRANIPAPGS